MKASWNERHKLWMVPVLLPVLSTDPKSVLHRVQRARRAQGRLKGNPPTSTNPPFLLRDSCLQTHPNSLPEKLQTGFWTCHFSGWFIKAVFKTLCAQERARAKRKGIFELRAATIRKNNPHIHPLKHLAWQYGTHGLMAGRATPGWTAQTALRKMQLT